jgi:hypothetical protein
MAIVPKPAIVTREEWGSKPQPIPDDRKQVPTWVTIHHAGELWHDNDDPVAFVKHMQVWGQNRPKLEKPPRDTYWPDLPYHFLIAPDGRIFEGRPTQYEPESNTKYPLSGNIGVEMMGDFNVQRPTLKEIQSCVKLTAWLCQQYHIDLDHVRTHRDAAADQTDCPGKDFYRYITDGQFKHWVKDTMQGKEPKIVPGPSSLSNVLASKSSDSSATDVSQTASASSSHLHLSESELTAVGNKVWRNECSGRIDGLTSWNVGEDFPSLGIGHFIWYPKNAHDKFEESFPRLVAFLQANGVSLPSWLNADMRCPWDNRADFLQAVNGKELTELRSLLTKTVPIQTKFIVQRLENALPKVLDNIAPAEREKIKTRFYKVLSGGSDGAFALIDYVNFKGEGVNVGERYHDQGWGLLQVLQGMSDKDDPVCAFSQSAATVLTRRVQNAPPERHEERWLAGWKKRVSNYALK